jgi:hypothetical protein
MPKLYFETEDGEAPPHEFGGPTDVVLYFLSLAFATRYGSQHDLSKLALLLRGKRQVRLEPLTTFADRNVEEEADERDLERAWQDAPPLAETAGAVVAALDSGDEQIDALVAETPDLRDRIDDLRRMAEWAAERGTRVRLTFEL